MECLAQENNGGLNHVVIGQPARPREPRSPQVILTLTSVLKENADARGCFHTSLISS